MALLDDLLARMRATRELTDIQILENDSVDDETFVFKVRATIVSSFLQIRFLADRDLKRYSFQLYSDHPLMRWDNAPHYPNTDNFPHHFHDEDENISSSMLAGELLSDYDIVIASVLDFIAGRA